MEKEVMRGMCHRWFDSDIMAIEMSLKFKTRHFQP